MANLKQELPEWCQKDFVHFQDTFTYSPEDKVLEWNDHLFIPQFHPDTVSYAFDHHEPRENEVMVASCVKTGTTWTREIIRQILYGRDEKLDKLTKDITLPHLYLETCTPSKFNVMHNIPIPRRYFVTHLPAELVNLEKYEKRNIKIVYTLRNPKDRLVSFFHFVKGFPWQGELARFSPDDWNDYFERQMKDPLPLAIRKGESYLDHILSWLPHIKNNKNAILIVYEEMIKNPFEKTKELSEFLGVELSDDEIYEIVKNCSIDNMKKSDMESKSEDGMNRHATKQCFTGTIGKWKNYFTAEQSDEIDRQVEEKMKETGIEFIYE
ncbi:cytosolic sulfotransferase 3-like isoform X1 [Styela clava]